MKRKKYHIKDIMKRGSPTYMYDLLQDAKEKAWNIIMKPSGPHEVLITKLAPDGRSYRKFALVQQIVDYRTSELRGLYRRWTPNGWK